MENISKILNDINSKTDEAITALKIGDISINKVISILIEIKEDSEELKTELNV